MTNNRLPLIHDPHVSPFALRARNRLIRLYNALRRKKVKGGWRAVQKVLLVRNVATVYNFAVHGVEPKNIEERKKLGLKKFCPTCKRKVDEPKRKMRRIFDMPSKELLWRLQHREVIQ